MGLKEWQLTYLVICLGIGMVLCAASFLLECIDKAREREMFDLWETLELMDEKKAREAREAEAAKEQPPAQ